MFTINTNTKGFTLVEIMIVVGIIAVLAGIFLVGSGQFRDAANSARIKADLQKIEAVQEVYYTMQDPGGYAGSIAALTGAGLSVPTPPASGITYSTDGSGSCATGDLPSGMTSPHCLPRN